ncbi:DUF5592 family protein [Bacillus subtilis]|uniref:DUF5592 family protein n=1 Tax=Bacillus TaxID=1386 RepID=UPI0013BCF5C6|nr:DUF5592 family protein [Bacillus subtilis]KAF2427335.1 hypothetical protein B6K89_03900 [Bacillus subtilis]MCY9145696.1 DUF5592 family protein [Bacillus sp. T9C1]MEC0312073.1 DUF5592 family protein [Bacillus subtilis]MEC0363619.1 DUF5592 family protein [Bacillus subtilis]
MRNYRIPKEISSELKLSKNLYLFDLLFLISLALISMMLRVFIHPSLIILYYIFFGIIGVVSIIRPATNPEKRMYQVIIIALVRNRSSYCAIDREDD